MRLPVIMETSFLGSLGRWQSDTIFLIKFSASFHRRASHISTTFTLHQRSLRLLYIRPFRIGTICPECYSNCHKLSAIFSPCRESAPPQGRPRPRVTPRHFYSIFPLFIFFLISRWMNFEGSDFPSKIN